MSETITIIRPGDGWSPRLRLWRYRDLLWSFVLRDITVRYRQTILGPLWLIIQPLAMAGVLTAVVSGVIGVSTNGQPPSLFYLTAMIMWVYFSQVVLAIGYVFITHEYLFSKVYFPRICIPLSILISNAAGIVIQLLPLAVLIIAFATKGRIVFLPAHLLVFPFAVVLLLAYALGVGLLVASSTAKYRDLANALPYALQLWLFLTPVFYSYDKVPTRFHPYLALLNPLSVISSLWRGSVLGGFDVTSLDVALAAASTGLVLFLGLVLFQRVERTVADTI